MFLDDGRMLNANGSAISVPVFPNPLSGDIKLTGYENNAFVTPGATSKNFSNIVSDGNYMWNISMTTPGKLNRFKIETGEFDVISLGVNVYGDLICDGKYIWIMQMHYDFCIYRINVQTLEVSGVSLENYVNNNTNTFDVYQGSGINHGVYDGKNLWFFGYCKPTGANTQYKFVKLDLQTEVATGYSISPNYNNAMLFQAKNCVYLVAGYSKSPIYKFDFATTKLEYLATIPDSILPSGSNCYTAAFDGKSIWLATSTAFNYYTVANNIIEFDTKTNTVKGHVMQGENIGDCGAPTITERFMACSFDGRYVWFAPRNVNRILRLDTTDASMKGYSLTGNNLGNVDSVKTPKFTGCLFDGKDVWMFPGDADRIVKLSSGSAPPTYQIVEKFQNIVGVALQSDIVKTVAAGSSYVAAIPPISGYQYIGYKINGGTLQSGIPSSTGVNANYEVIFVYEQNNTCNVKLTENFLDVNRITIAPSQNTVLSIGQNYSRTAPAIAGYQFRGYVVDNGLFQIFTTVNLYAVASDHVINFIYEKINTSGCCKCLKVEKLCPIAYATGQLIEATHGLTIDAEKALCDVRLQCVESEAGYNVGAYIESFSMDYHEWGDTPARAKLTNDKISLQVGSANNGFLAVNAVGGQFRPTPSKWRLVFRIWYQ